MYFATYSFWRVCSNVSTVKQILNNKLLNKAIDIINFVKRFSIALAVCEVRAIFSISSKYVNLICLFSCDDTFFKLGK